MAKERSPIATCSPVARMTSSSRSLGDSVISWASWRSRSVSPAMADITTTTSCPALFTSTIRLATRWIRPTSPTEVPPYFWTTRVTSLPPALDRHPETELPPEPCKVVDARHHAQDYRNPDRKGPHEGTRIEDQQDDRNDLRRHLVLPELGRGDDQPLRSRNAPEPGDGDISPDDDRRHPGRHPPDLHQGDERRRDQQLVGDGIQELPEGGDLSPASGNATVQPVGEDRRQENGRRRIIAGVSAANQENDQEGNQEDSNEGQRMRQSHRRPPGSRGRRGRNSARGPPTGIK